MSAKRDMEQTDMATASSQQDEATSRQAPYKEEAGDEPEDESAYVKGVSLILLTLGLSLAVLVIALDNSILGTALPNITSVFNSLDDVGWWYGSAYLLATCALQPLSGKLYTYFNVKYTFLVAVFLFEIGSILCAAATSSGMFIAGRVVAGAGAAAIFSGGLTIVGYAVPLVQRPLYIAIISSMFGIASALGPVLGGVFTSKASWRWCFWINLPIGGVAMIVVFFFFKNPVQQYRDITIKQRIKELDLPGAFFLVCSVICLLLALQWGGQTYSWGNSKVWGLILGFSLLLIVFAAIQAYKQDQATLPPRLLKQRTIITSCLYTAFVHMALYTHLFYIPFYFQAVKGVSAENSGIRLIAFLVAMTVASIIAGGLITKFGYYMPFMLVGGVLYTIGSGLLYTLDLDTRAGKWIGYQVLAGFGIGLSVQIPFIAIQVVSNKKDMPVSNALVLFFNTLGGALATSIAANILLNTLQEGIRAHAAGLDPQLVIHAGVTHFRRVVPERYLAAVIVAYRRAVVDTFLFAVVAAGLSLLVSLGMEWKSTKPQSSTPSGGEVQQSANGDAD